MMASSNGNTPQDIKLHKRSRMLELVYPGERYELSFEYLRVNSPSAEVRGHSESQRVLQTGKKDVSIEGVTPVGNYAIKIHFDDGHDSGLYSWDYLKFLAENKETLWQEYLEALEKAGKGRDKEGSKKPGTVGHFDPSAK